MASGQSIKRLCGNCNFSLLEAVVGDGSRCFMGYNYYLHVKNGSALIHSSYAVAGVHRMEPSCAPLFIFTGAGKDQGTVMSIINVTAAGRRIESAKATEILKEFNLLLEEVETLLEEELIAVYFLKMADQEKQAAAIPMILKMPIRLLVGKKNRTIRQEAILAYAKKKLRELGQED